MTPLTGSRMLQEVKVGCGEVLGASMDVDDGLQTPGSLSSSPPSAFTPDKMLSTPPNSPSVTGIVPFSTGWEPCVKDNGWCLTCLRNGSNGPFRNVNLIIYNGALSIPIQWIRAMFVLWQSNLNKKNHHVKKQAFLIDGMVCYTDINFEACK